MDFEKLCNMIGTVNLWNLLLDYSSYFRLNLSHSNYNIANDRQLYQKMTRKRLKYLTISAMQRNYYHRLIYNSNGSFPSPQLNSKILDTSWTLTRFQSDFMDHILDSIECNEELSCVGLA